MRILLFTGAGASVELGIPAMREMAEQLAQHLRDQHTAPNVVDQIDQFLVDDQYDIENLIDQVDSIEKGLVNQREWGIEANEGLVESFGMVRQEAEWFVPHSCERVLPLWAGRMWTASLRHLIGHDVTIATTNYDRSIEIAATKLGLKLEDGFEDFGARELATWTGIGKSENIKLLKLHGSTDWYQGEDATVYKLRHAMPLYGGLTLTIDNLPFLHLTSASVLPSREKKVTQPPYPDLNTEFRNRSKEAEIAVFLGTSLRDPDIHGVFAECALRIPTYVISRSGEFAEGLIPKSATVIRQSASRFLISTLPGFLRQPKPEGLHKFSEGGEEFVAPVLNWLITATDSDSPTEERCKAIEDLASARVALESEHIEELLNAEDVDVHVNALGLIQDSPDRDGLLKFSLSVANERPDSIFADEVRLLSDLLVFSEQQRE